MRKQIFKVKMGRSTLMLEVKAHLFTVSAKMKVKKEEFVNTLERECKNARKEFSVMILSAAVHYTTHG